MNKASAGEVQTTSALLGPQTRLYGLFGVLAGLVFPVIASLLDVTAQGLPLTVSSLAAVQQQEPSLWITDTAPLILGLVAAIAGWRQDVVLEANKALRIRDAELKSIRENLEQTVDERTRELDEKNAQMRAVVAFARQLAEIPEVKSLQSIAVQSISERFGYPEVNLYRLDERGQSVSLKASSTPAGKRLVNEGFRVAVSDQTTVGRVARRGKMLSFLGKADASFKGPHATAAGSQIQLALPLLVHGKVIGVLDVQSAASGVTRQNEAEILQLVADQLAASIENARLVSESQEAVQQLEALTTKGTRATWQAYIQGNPLRSQSASAGLGSTGSSGDSDTNEVRTVPLFLHGQEIGSMRLRRKTGNHWTAAETEFVEKIAGQLSLALENARLLDETQHRATQEQIVSEISARFSSSLDVDALLQTAVREFAALPDVAEAAVVLNPSGGSPMNQEN